MIAMSRGRPSKAACGTNGKRPCERAQLFASNNIRYMAPMLKFDDKGLIVAVAQDAASGDIRMVAWMNAEAVRQTLATGKATFFSRSRGRLWTKGETSGNLLAVRAVYVDCDADSLILRVTPTGPTCHTGQPTCFFRRLAPGGETPKIQDSEVPPATFLNELEHEIAQRASSALEEKSYTKFLLSGGETRIGEKLREEAGELADAIAGETDERVAAEAADVVFHMMVGLRSRGVSLRQVIEVLAGRAGVSGHQEKASRSPARG
jgi:phosphoribosyl-AMP cyclohydrolase / phosphoribosyl-ATP pyrophosphohydrolase